MLTEPAKLVRSFDPWLLGPVNQNLPLTEPAKLVRSFDLQNLRNWLEVSTSCLPRRHRHHGDLTEPAKLVRSFDLQQTVSNRKGKLLTEPAKLVRSFDE